MRASVVNKDDVSGKGHNHCIPCNLQGLEPLK